MSSEPLLPESDPRCLNQDVRVDVDVQQVSPSQDTVDPVDEGCPESTSGTEDMAAHSGWRSWWLVRWGRLKIVDPLYLIVSRYAFAPIKL